MNESERDISALRMIDRNFEHDVLEKLSRLEAKMDTLTGNGQPGGNDAGGEPHFRAGAQRRQADCDRTICECRDCSADQRGGCAAWALVEMSSAASF
jgi:hypothetical protein